MRAIFDKKLLVEVLSVQSKSDNDSVMMKYLKNKVKSIAKDAIVTEDTYGNIYVRKGKAKLYPCLVSHTDTVHDIHKDFKVYEQGGLLFAFSADAGSQVGIGGDDKNGIFVCLSALKDLDAVKLVFFRNEEIGCKGSGEADMKFFDDCTIVCQADRKGHEGFVTKACSTELSSEVFQKHIEPILTKHQYKTCNGSITDVMTLKERGLDICTFNIECAYYNPHSDSEIVHIEYLSDCYKVVMEIIEACKGSRWLHKYEKPVYMPKVGEYGYYGGYSRREGRYRGSNRIFNDSFDLNQQPELFGDTLPKGGRRDIVDRRVTPDIISDDPREVNKYLTQNDEEEVEDELSEEIQLIEELAINKADFDTTFQELQDYYAKKAEKAGRL